MNEKELRKIAHEGLTPEAVRLFDRAYALRETQRVEGALDEALASMRFYLLGKDLANAEALVPQVKALRKTLAVLRKML